MEVVVGEKIDGSEVNIFLVGIIMFIVKGG